LKKILLTIYVTLFAQNIYAQTTDSCQTRISLLTCTPGSELYSIFGHSALRVVDPTNGRDIVFNYGTFDFYDPRFYQKFTSGRLLYFVSIDQLDGFLEEYKYYQRGVTEQVLNLSCDEKSRFIAALFENAKEENKYYRYDFNYDNCTTRLRDMLEKATGKPMQTSNIIPYKEATFRNLIHDYLDKGHLTWSKLGIDILLGSPLDKVVTNREAMFLPDYLMMAFDSTQLSGQKLVAEKREILPWAMTERKRSVFTPFLFFSILLVLVIVLTLTRSNAAIAFFKVFDPLIFLLSGLLGTFLIYMWVGTLHPMARNNYNLLWALPSHLLAAPFLFSKKQWVKRYFYIVAIFYLGLLAAWYFLPQQMNLSILPLVAILLVRAAVISKRSKS
jgi:hypothetical protein